MNPTELRNAERDRQVLLQQLSAAETALRGGLPINGFGSAARAHMERAVAHIREAHTAINETKCVRSVPQLVDDLNRIQQFMADVRRRNTLRI
jgi:hypothetical protein